MNLLSNRPGQTLNKLRVVVLFQILVLDVDEGLRPAVFPRPPFHRHAETFCWICGRCCSSPASATVRISPPSVAGTESTLSGTHLQPALVFDKIRCAYGIMMTAALPKASKRGQRFSEVIEQRQQSTSSSPYRWRAVALYIRPPLVALSAPALSLMVIRDREPG